MRKLQADVIQAILNVLFNEASPIHPTEATRAELQASLLGGSSQDVWLKERDNPDSARYNLHFSFQNHTGNVAQEMEGESRWFSSKISVNFDTNYIVSKNFDALDSQNSAGLRKIVESLSAIQKILAQIEELTEDTCWISRPDAHFYQTTHEYCKKVAANLEQLGASGRTQIHLTAESPALLKSSYKLDGKVFSKARVTTCQLIFMTDSEISTTDSE